MKLNRLAWGVCMPAALFLQACTSLLTPIGQNNYECNRSEDPSSPHCHSFKAAEASTQGRLPDSRFDQAVRMTDVYRLAGIAPVSSSASAASAAGAAGVAGVAGAAAPQGSAVSGSARPALPASPMEGVPVREAPVIQRVWVKRYVDGNDMLVTGTYVYKEIQPSRWAGFVAADGASTGRRPYPHRPAAQALQPATAAAKTAPPQTEASVNAGRPEFIQPGVKAPSGVDELAPVPATSGTSPMPQ